MQREKEAMDIQVRNEGKNAPTFPSAKADDKEDSLSW